MNPLIKERIFKAADTLYEKAAAGEFPNVESVRQLSKAGMNNVVAALKEWRELKQTTTQQINTPLPTEFQNALMIMGHQLWDEAQARAKASFEEKRVKFDAEKTEWLRLSQEQSEAYEALLAQHEQLKADHQQVTNMLVNTTKHHDFAVEQKEATTAEATRLLEQLSTERINTSTAQNEVHNLKGELATLKATLTITQKQLKELDPLKGQITSLHQEKAIAQAECTQLTKALADQKKRSLDEIQHQLEKLQKHEQATVAYRKEVRRLSEQLAKSTGALEVTKIQINDLKSMLQKQTPKRLTSSTKSTKG